MSYGYYWLRACGRILVFPATAPFGDRIAIEQGIWSISDVYTKGLNLFGLPIEEATFFLVTNLLVVQGLLLSLVVIKLL